MNENQIAQFVTETGITYPILQDESTGGGPGGFGGVTYDEYYIPNQGSPYPRDFIVDQNGILVYANNEIDTEYMIYILEVLLAGEELVVDNPVAVPFQFELFPAYPNPFNPTTTLKYDLPEDAIVNLKVMDILGNTVKALRKGVVPAGFYTVLWNGNSDDGSPVSPGEYLCSLKVGANYHTMKMVVLR